MGLLDKIFGTPADEEEYVDYENNDGYDVSSSAVTDEEAGFSAPYTPSVSNNISRAINIHSNSITSKITVMKPTSFEEMMDEFISSLRDGTIIFVNLTEISTEEGARIVDFMTGAAYMCDGRIEKLQARCYAVAPKNVEWIKTIKDN